VLQVNCKSVYNKAIELWSLVDTYTPDVVSGTESWIKEDISIVEVFSVNFHLSEKIGLPVVFGFLCV
jgi:hypothetical protein